MKRRDNKVGAEFDVFYPAPGIAGRSKRGSAILSYGIDSIKSFYELFESVRKRRLGAASRGGWTTHTEQDLLRSMLVFSAATLDGVVKQVIRDQIPKVDQLPTKAKEEFRKYISKQLSKGMPVNYEALASSLAGENPRTFFIEGYIRELTGDSLQSKDQLLRAAAAVGVELNLKKDDINDLERLFEARNQIIHELDYLTAKKKKKQRNRRNRNIRDIIRWSKSLLSVGQSFLQDAHVAQAAAGTG